jgi:hypothetical protein
MFSFKKLTLALVSLSLVISLLFLVNPAAERRSEIEWIRS